MISRPESLTRPETAAPPAEVLPMTPTLLGITVDHERTLDGPVTIIVRRFDRPDLCRLCPRAACHHEPGYCVVRVRAHVPDASCATYAAPAVAAASLAGHRVEGA